MGLRGETVLLEKADGTQVVVRDVLAHPADLSDQTVQDVQTRFINQARYKGDQLTLTLYWPKAADHDLMDAHVTLRGERYRVYGTPFPYDDAVCPTRWDEQVTVTRSLYLFDLELGIQASVQDEWGSFREGYDWVPIKGNLLRLAEDSEHGAGTEGPSGILMFELRRRDWPDRDSEDKVAVLRYPAGEGGRIYRMSATAYAQETLVVTATGGLTDA